MPREASLELLDALKAYQEAKQAFESCSELYLSSGISEKAQKISDCYFKARLHLFQLASLSENSQAKSWVRAFENVKICCDLVNSGETGEAAARMAVLSVAEKQFCFLIKD